MKFKLFFLAAGFALCTLFSAKPNDAHTSANARQYQGVSIFSDSDPVDGYTVLGTVKSAGVGGSSQYEDVRDRLLKKAKKEYPTCNGLILNLKAGRTDQADAILFK